MQISEERQKVFEQRRSEVDAAEALLRRVRLSCGGWMRSGIPMAGSGGWFSAADLLTRPDISLEQVVIFIPCCIRLVCEKLGLYAE